MGFLSLPQEIRLIIYDLLLGDRVCYIDFKTPGIINGGIVGSLEILRVNKQINAEALTVFRADTLLLEGVNLGNAILMQRLPRLIPSHLNRIQNVYIKFHKNVFGALFIRSNHFGTPWYTLKVVESLQSMVSHLSQLKRVVLSCDHIPPQGEREDWIAKLVRLMGQYLQDFNHATFVSKENPSLGRTCGEVEFSKESYRKATLQEADQGHAKPGGTKVLLDVIDGQNSHSVRWLTVA